MDNSTQPESQSQSTNPTTELPPRLKSTSLFKTTPVLLSIAATITMLLASVVYLISQSQQLASQPAPIAQASPTPTPNPTANWKIYTNTTYGFQLSYPPTGVVQEKGKTKENAACGKAIKEGLDGMGAYVLVDNFFKVNIFDWSQTIDDYLIQKRAKNIYQIEPITTANADEAVKVIGLKKGLEVTSVGYPPLMYVSHIYKKNNKLFILKDLLEPTNLGGCIPFSTMDPLKMKDQNPEIKNSFKFINQGAEGKSCGGFVGEQGPMACPSGYYCKYTYKYPDEVGKCVKR